MPVSDGNAEFEPAAAHDMNSSAVSKHVDFIVIPLQKIETVRVMRDDKPCHHFCRYLAIISDSVLSLPQIIIAVS